MLSQSDIVGHTELAHGIAPNSQEKEAVVAQALLWAFSKQLAIDFDLHDGVEYHEEVYEEDVADEKGAQVVEALGDHFDEETEFLVDDDEVDNFEEGEQNQPYFNEGINFEDDSLLLLHLQKLQKYLEVNNL